MWCGVLRDVCVVWSVEGHVCGWSVEGHVCGVHEVVGMSNCIVFVVSVCICERESITVSSLDPSL